MFHIVQVKLVVNVCEEVPHPQSPMTMVPGHPVEQYDITFTAKSRRMNDAAAECHKKLVSYCEQIGATSVETPTKC